MNQYLFFLPALGADRGFWFFMCKKVEYHRVTEWALWNYETFGPARTFLYMMMSLLCKALLSFVTPRQEGKPQTLQVMKHFLQRFEPGVDRLDGVEHIEGTNGAAILRCGSWKIPGRNLGRLPVDSSDIGCLPVDMENLLRLLADSGRNRGLFMKRSEKFGTFFSPVRSHMSKLFFRKKNRGLEVLRDFLQSFYTLQDGISANP